MCSPRPCSSTEWPSGRSSFRERHLVYQDAVAHHRHAEQASTLSLCATPPAVCCRCSCTFDAGSQVATLVAHRNSRISKVALDDAEFTFRSRSGRGPPRGSPTGSTMSVPREARVTGEQNHHLEGLVSVLAAESGVDRRHSPRRCTQRRTSPRQTFVSQVVIEYPVLQGVIGGLYAAAGIRATRSPGPWASTTARSRPRRRCPARCPAPCLLWPTRPTTSWARGSRSEALGFTRSVRLAARGHGHRP